MNKGWVIFITVLLIIFMTMSIFLFVNIYRRPSAKSEDGSSVKGKAVIFNTGSPFVTNIKGDKSILKCDIYIEAYDKDAAEQLQKDIPRIRDRVIIILRNLTPEDVERKDIQEKLKEDIKSDLQENLGVQSITDIYFNEFVVQY